VRHAVVAHPAPLPIAQPAELAVDDATAWSVRELYRRYAAGGWSVRKLALWLKEQGNTPLLVAADLQRPNAVQQLQILGEQAGVPVFAPEPGNGVGDPVAVARQSIDEAKRRLHNTVVIDTAGRLGIDAELMQQAAAIRDAVRPDAALVVADAAHAVSLAGIIGGQDTEIGPDTTAVLLEAGSIVNRQEELELATPERRTLTSEAVAAAVEDFCAARAHPKTEQVVKRPANPRTAIPVAR